MVVFVNNEKKAIFIHNVKCGGCYMREILVNNYEFIDTHISSEIHENLPLFFNSLSEIDYFQDVDCHTIRKLGKYRFITTHQMFKDINFSEYFVFSFVRNPYDKLYSAYCYLKKKIYLSGNKIRNSFENINFYKTFRDFVINYNNLSNIAFFHAFIPQYEQFLDFSNNINIQYIGKQENLNDELINILNIIGFEDIKHIQKIYLNIKINNRSESKMDMLNDYTEDIFLFVNKFFEKDFEIFNYKKYDCFEEFKNSHFVNNNLQHISYYNKPTLNKYDLFVDINSMIKYKINTNRKIPNNIIQTYKNGKIHPHIHENIQRMLSINPTYNYYFITDEIGYQLIEKYFNNTTLEAFKKLKVGAAKGDFLRYIALYIYGGCYIDLDAGININLDNFIDMHVDMILLKDEYHLTLTNWCIFTTPHNDIIKITIEEMVRRIHNSEKNIILTTGPTLLTDVIYNYINKSNIFDILKTCNSNIRNDFLNSLHIYKDEIYNIYFLNSSDINKNKQIVFNMSNYSIDMLYPYEWKYNKLESIYTNPEKNITDDTSLALKGPLLLSVKADAP
jgi:mannosyltransferase OCH1-like enzyme